MGGCFSVSLPCDQTVNQVSQWLCLKWSNVRNVSRNLSSLEKAMEVLKAKRDDVQTRVNREELTRRNCRLFEVQLWLDSVLTIENQISDLISTYKVEHRRMCLCSFCSKDLIQRYRFGKSVIMMLKEVKSLSSQGQFDVVTEPAPVAQAEEMPIHPTIVGQETLLDRVWNHLMEEEVGIVGLYGMGGVGKTTLLTQINNKFSESIGLFNVVIWVVVSNGATIRKIQGDISRKLGFKVKEWVEENESERALDIHNALKQQKFVLLLDDIWEKVNFEAVEIPYPSRENGCKVAFTTRSKEVCGRMGVGDPIKVVCLNPEKSWDLFQKKVGVKTIESHSEISELAKKVVSKCCGLPLALNVIGETMACKTTVHEWHHAVNVLTSYAVEFSGMENEILPILKYSYDNLSGEQVKSCFLYCCLFPEDYEIQQNRLIKYWICEKFIDENGSTKMAISQGLDIIGTLIRSCLLDESNNGVFVRMHDVVREMGLWIASDFGKQKDQCIVKAGVQLSKVPKVKNWNAVRRMSLMNNKIKMIVDSAEFPQLTTLFLQKNRTLLNISEEFFLSMPKLLVLELSGNHMLVDLPDFSNLVSLRYLDLKYTNIKSLPLGFQALKMLIHLNLERTERLESVNGISNLSSLKTLLLQDSNTKLDINLMKELEFLEDLEYISININPNMVMEELLYDSRAWESIQEITFKDLPKESTSILVLLARMVHLRYLNIRNTCVMWEIEIEKTYLLSPCFSSLSSVLLECCDGVKDLTWLMFAPNLTSLFIKDLDQLEGIIKEEKTASDLAEEEESHKIIPFGKLRKLHLSRLTLLKSIYETFLPFPCLDNVSISKCPNLKKLPFNSQSVVKIEKLTINYNNDEEWKEAIEWEDETTRLRFLHSFKRKLL